MTSHNDSPSSAAAMDDSAETAAAAEARWALVPASAAAYEVERAPVAKWAAARADDVVAALTRRDRAGAEAARRLVAAFLASVLEGTSDECDEASYAVAASHALRAALRSAALCGLARSAEDDEAETDALDLLVRDSEAARSLCEAVVLRAPDSVTDALFAGMELHARLDWLVRGVVFLEFGGAAGLSRAAAEAVSAAAVPRLARFAARAVNRGAALRRLIGPKRSRDPDAWLRRERARSAPAAAALARWILSAPLDAVGDRTDVDRTLFHAHFQFTGPDAATLDPVVSCAETVRCAARALAWLGLAETNRRRRERLDEEGGRRRPVERFMDAEGDRSASVRVARFLVQWRPDPVEAPRRPRRLVFQPGAVSDADEERADALVRRQLRGAAARAGHAAGA